MNRTGTAFVILAWILLLALPARSGDTRYILAPAIIQADKAAYSFRSEEQLQGLHREFVRSVETTFPGLHRPLSETNLLNPDQQTVLLVPQLTVVRRSKSSIAGTLDRYEAVLVGDITLMDPWSMTRLFSATRMVVRAKELSRDGYSSDQISRAIQEAFEDAGRAWIRECLSEVKAHAHPFSLRAEVLPSQSGVRLKGGGGFWPYGSHEGLNRLTLLAGPNRKRLKVREVFPHFSVVADALDPSRSLDSSEAYEAALVRDEAITDRSEPRVAIQWIGPLPATPSPTMGIPLSAQGWAGLLANYLGKDGRFRILPIPIFEEGLAADSWDALKDRLRSFSNRTKEEFTQDATAVKAQEDPDVRVEIGLADIYYGTMPGEMGSTDHYFNVTWALRWFERDGEGGEGEGSGRLLFKGVEFHREQSALRTKTGLRELDLDSAWFNLCRNGIIRIAKLVADRIRPAQVSRRGVVNATHKVTWQGQAPDPNSRLSLRRAMGVIRNKEGKDLGTYFGKEEPITLAKVDRCDPGDEIRVLSGSKGPLVTLLPLDLPEGPGLLRQEWIQSRLADLLLKALPMELDFHDTLPTGPGESDQTRYLRLRVDTLRVEPQPNAMNLGGTWRLRLYKGTYDSQGEPVFKLGLRREGPVPFGQASMPRDTGSAVLGYQNSALDELIKRTTPGLKEALSKE